MASRIRPRPQYDAPSPVVPATVFDRLQNLMRWPGPARIRILVLDSRALSCEGAAPGNLATMFVTMWGRTHPSRRCCSAAHTTRSRPCERIKNTRCCATSRACSKFGGPTEMRPKPELVDSCQGCPCSANVAKYVFELGSNSADIGPNLVDPGQNLAEHGRIRSYLGIGPDLVKVWRPSC